MVGTGIKHFYEIYKSTIVFSRSLLSPLSPTPGKKIEKIKRRIKVVCERKRV